MILLPLIARVDRAAPEGPRGSPEKSDLTELVVETALESAMVAAARLAMVSLVACVLAGWGLTLACRSTVGVFRRLAGLIRARCTPAGGEAKAC